MTTLSYRYCHFPPGVIQHAVWLNYRLTLSFRDVEDMLAERGVEVRPSGGGLPGLDHRLRGTCAAIGLFHIRSGIAMRCSSLSAVGACICGVPPTRPRGARRPGPGQTGQARGNETDAEAA